jgi:dipeptidyl aminopeptidase/acylaminoacyl peptidase
VNIQILLSAKEIGRFISPLLTLTLITASVTAEQKHTITPEDLVSLRIIADANISPDGRRIAFVVSEPTAPGKTTRDENIWIVPVDRSEPARQYAASAKNENTPRWSPDGRWLAFISDRSDDNQRQVWVMRADGGEAEKLTSTKAGVDSFKWSPDGRAIAFLARDDRTEEEQKKADQHDDAIHVDHDNKYTRLWVTALNDRKAALVTKGDIEVKDFDWAPDGASFAIAFGSKPGFEEMTYQLAIVRRQDGQLSKTLTDNVSDYLNIRWSPDASKILFFEASPSRYSRWISIALLETGDIRPLLKDYEWTPWQCAWEPDSKHLVAEAAVGTRIKLLRLDVRSGEPSELADVLNNFPDFSVSADGRTLAFINETAETPGDVWWFTSGREPEPLTSFHSQVSLLKLGSLREISWKSKTDGQVLRGVLITPPSFESIRRYPTVVNTHVGDWAWWSGWQGSWWQWGQLLASNGYVVFLPNSRGVTGQGWKFHDRIADWGGVAFDDIMDGLDYLIEQNIADPNRLAIGGWSNGGFMAEWAITHTKHFKAAVAFAAPADFQIMWAASPAAAPTLMNLWGTPMHARETYDAHSPIHFVRNCTTPTLIGHGETDPVVPITQAYEFYHALMALGVETDMVVYPREGHSLDEPAHQIDFQKRVLAWFDKHLK